MKRLTATLTLAAITMIGQQSIAQNMPKMDHNDQPASSNQTHNPASKMAVDHSKHASKVKHSSGKSMADNKAIYAAGIINNVASGKLNITHEPIAAIGWPKMKMDFNVAKSVDLSLVKPGARIHFSLEKTGKHQYVITGIHPWVHNIEDHNM